MTSKTGSGLTFTISSNANNQLIGNFCYDNNGNLASDQYSCSALNYTPNYTYDVVNRLVSYVYDADNKRISTISANGTQTVFIYGAGGEKLSVAGPGGGSGISNNVYFAGRLIKQNTDVFGASGPSNLDDHFVAVDRLGSVKSSYQLFGTAYMPYGEESVTSPNDQMKFATYTRDSSTGLDYADQRFYTSQFGRFMSADRYKKSADPSNPGSWNRFIYSFNDPVNLSDPTGRSPSKDVDNCSIDANPEDDDCEDGNGDTGGGGGGVTFSVTGTCGEECGDEDGSGGNDTSGGSTDTASAGSGAFGPPLTTTALPCPQQRILNATGLTPQGPPISVGGHNQFPVTMRPGQQPPGFSPFKIFGINNGYRTTNTLKSVHISVNGSQPGTYQAHIDIFNPATGLLGILGHLVWDMGLGTTLQTLGAPSGVLDPKCN
jgi:RHS repeat-associated protein